MTVATADTLSPSLDALQLAREYIIFGKYKLHSILLLYLSIAFIVLLVTIISVQVLSSCPGVLVGSRIQLATLIFTYATISVFVVDKKS